MSPAWSLSASADHVPATERTLLRGAISAGGPAEPSWIVLDTCHRVELYGFGERPAAAGGMLLREGRPAVVHLLRVAAGLESAVVGEDEILHQVREAHRLTLAAARRDNRLHRLFEVAIATGRKARAGRTATGAGLAERAIAWLGERSDLAGHPVLVAGAGRMGSALAHAAADAGAQVTVASRSAAKARRLARVYDGEGIDLAEAAGRARRSAAVAIALGGEWRDLTGPVTGLPPIADISAPSAVPASVRSALNGGFLSIDDLFQGDRPVPTAYIEQAERIVAAKADEYLAWLEGRA